MHLDIKGCFIEFFIQCKGWDYHWWRLAARSRKEGCHRQNTETTKGFPNKKSKEASRSSGGKSTASQNRRYALCFSMTRKRPPCFWRRLERILQTLDALIETGWKPSFTSFVLTNVSYRKHIEMVSLFSVQTRNDNWPVCSLQQKCWVVKCSCTGVDDVIVRKD